MGITSSCVYPACTCRSADALVCTIFGTCLFYHVHFSILLVHILPVPSSDPPLRWFIFVWYPSPSYRVVRPPAFTQSFPTDPLRRLVCTVFSTCYYYCISYYPFIYDLQWSLTCREVASECYHLTVKSLRT